MTSTLHTCQSNRQKNSYSTWKGHSCPTILRGKSMIKFTISMITITIIGTERSDQYNKINTGSVCILRSFSGLLFLVLGWHCAGDGTLNSKNCLILCFYPLMRPTRSARHYKLVTSDSPPPPPPPALLPVPEAVIAKQLPCTHSRPGRAASRWSWRCPPAAWASRRSGPRPGAPWSGSAAGRSGWSALPRSWRESRCRRAWRTGTWSLPPVPVWSGCRTRPGPLPQTGRDCLAWPLTHNRTAKTNDVVVLFLSPLTWVLHPIPAPTRHTWLSLVAKCWRLAVWTEVTPTASFLSFAQKFCLCVAFQIIKVGAINR